MANLAEVVNELQQERDRLDQAIVALTSLNGIPSSPKRKTHTMSSAARRRIAAAQRRRWARKRGAAESAKFKPARKRHISAAGIARIRAAAKARWAKVRAEKKK